MADDDLTLEDEDDDRAIIRNAHRRFLACERWEARARKWWREDYRFAHGDSENNYQWPGHVYSARNSDQRPTLTINKVRQHNLMIINEAKQNKAGIKYRPIGGGASAESSEIYEGIARHIQNISLAQNAFGVAIEFQVHAGLGFTRVVTDYAGQDTFDQEVFIRPVPDPMSCYLDPDAAELDGSDARFGFIFCDRPKDEVHKKYPELKGRGTPANAVDSDDAGWFRDDHIREAEYYAIEEIADELLGTLEGEAVYRSLLNGKIVKGWEEDAKSKGLELRRRKVIRKAVKWYKIVGDIIVDRADWPGETIPIIPWIGEQTIIDQTLDRKGHTRALKDAQRMLNYNRSAAVEYGALQSKSPYIAPARAIEGYETYWETANTKNHAVLPYNDKDEEGGDIPAPVRQEPPGVSPAFIAGAEAAQQDMMMASGQYEAQMGAPGNERSGRAIQERQRQGDRATYHFIDNQAIAIRRHGAILLELIPKIYDTQRVVRILAEDGTEDQVQVDPTAKAALQVMQDGVTRIFNPGVGKYEVVADVGPDYATDRQEAFNAIVQILTQAPQLIDQIGDLLFKVADFPLADQISERLKPGLPQEAQQAIAALQQQLQNGNQLLAEAMQALSEERLKVKAKDSEANIKAFDADTRRLAVVKDMLPLDPLQLQSLIHETVRQALQDNLGPVIGASAAGLRRDIMGMPEPGAEGAMPMRTPDPGQAMATPGGGEPMPQDQQ